MSAERLFAMFNPHPPSMQRTSPGRDALRAEDVAHALAGLGRGAYLLALIKFAGDETPSLKEELRRILLLETGHIATAANWNVPRGAGYLRGMIEVALWEILDYSKRCHNCQGRGIVYPRGGAARDCSRCGGSGKPAPVDKERAKLAGIPLLAWRRMWFKRYWRVFGIVAGWEDEVRRHLRERLAQEGAGKPLAA